MPRNPRSYIKTSFFHIMVQGINKSYIFEKAEDIKYYISLMYQFKSYYNIEILAYCIMNNHAHLLIKQENISELTKYMHRVNTTYALHYNKKFNRVGYVFRDRYKCEGIYSQEHLYNCALYIYNNPVKAGICNTPEEYPYSSYKNTISKTEIINYNFIDADENSEERCKKIIENYLLENNLTIEKLKENKILLKQLLIELKNENNVSLRKISNVLEINRETLRILYK